MLVPSPCKEAAMQQKNQQLRALPLPQDLQLCTTNTTAPPSHP